MTNKCGMGINDADYPVTKSVTIEGKKVTLWRCPYHTLWRSMLERGISKKFKTRRKTYADVYVCEEWLVFSRFKKWVQLQPCHEAWLNGEGLDLDKDLLVEGNKVYGPDTCVFVPKKLNSLLVNCSISKNGLPMGVSLDRGLYRAQISSKTLGRFSTALEAHKAWLLAKSKLLAEMVEEYEEKDYANPDLVARLKGIAYKMRQDAATV